RFARSLQRRRRTTMLNVRKLSLAQVAATLALVTSSAASGTAFAGPPPAGFSYVNTYTGRTSDPNVSPSDRNYQRMEFSIAIPSEVGSGPVRGLLVIGCATGSDLTGSYMNSVYEPFLHLHNFAYIGSSNPDGGWPWFDPWAVGIFQDALAFFA